MSEAKETKEVVVALLKLAKALLPVLKDGVQASDALEVFELLKKDDALKAALLEAYNGADHVKEELKDLDAHKVIDIILVAIPELKDLIVLAAK